MYLIYLYTYVYILFDMYIYIKLFNSMSTHREENSLFKLCLFNLSIQIDRSTFVQKLDVGILSRDFKFAGMIYQRGVYTEINTLNPLNKIVL